MQALIVEPLKVPYVKEVGEELEDLQHEVGGYIEAVYPFEDEIAIVCNEEGKLNGLELNRALRGDDGEIYDIIAGKFLVVGLTNVMNLLNVSDYYTTLIKGGIIIGAMGIASFRQQRAAKRGV